MDQNATMKLTYGLFLLSAQNEYKDNACIINTAVQVANDPLRIAISVINANYTCDIIKETGKFNISAIDESATFELFKRFGMQSGRTADKFDGFTDVKRSPNGLYYLTKSANMFMSAKVVESHDLGSHTLFVAEVTDAEILGNVPSASYSFYHANIKPKPQAPKADEGEKKWVCKICGYVHTGSTPPEECPLCHHPASDFELVK